jgi:hypothetical protein
MHRERLLPLNPSNLPPRRWETEALGEETTPYPSRKGWDTNSRTPASSINANPLDHPFPFSRSRTEAGRNGTLSGPRLSQGRCSARRSGSGTRCARWPAWARTKAATWGRSSAFPHSSRKVSLRSGGKGKITGGRGGRPRIEPRNQTLTS